LWFVIRPDPGETGDAGDVLSTPVARDTLASVAVTRDPPACSTPYNNHTLFGV
jgi:hypothetical protein